MFQNVGKQLRILATVMWAIYLTVGFVLFMVGISQENAVVMLLAVVAELAGYISVLMFMGYARLVETNEESQKLLQQLVDMGAGGAQRNAVDADELPEL